MRRRLFSSFAMVLTCAAGVGLAGPQAGAGKDAGDNKTVTATGCLKQRKDLPTGASRIAGKPDDFMLLNARIKTADTSTDVAAPAADASGPRAMYKVVGLSAELLREHLNQDVEVEGRVSAGPTSGAAARQPGAAMGREPASTPSASAPPAQAPTVEGDRQAEPQPGDPQELHATSIEASGMRCQGT